MANGRFILGKQSGGTLGLVFPDGVSNTEVVLPESGELVTKEYVDNANVPFVANDNRVKTALNATGNAPIYACRAWVNFNGTGTVAIRRSGNVSSITDRGTGKYTMNMTIPMSSVNFSIVGSCGKWDTTEDPNTSVVFGTSSLVPTQSTVPIATGPAAGGPVDTPAVYVHIID